MSHNQYQLDWTSDAFAEVLRGLGLPYVALTPGSSFRGLEGAPI
jgi:hypothetical protein